MVNKLWYQGDYGPSELEDLICSRNYIQKYIDLYFSGIFKVPEDITTDNLQQFLEILLKYYEHYLFSWNELVCVGESISLYFHKAYFDDFPDTFFPQYPETDRRELVLTLLSEIHASQTIFPEDVPILIEYLNVPDTEIVSTHGKIKAYFEQFDQIQRHNIELKRRDEVLAAQRKEAIEKDQPIPIRPIGIRLDPCYKRDDIDWFMIRTKGPQEFIGKTNQEASHYGHNPQLLDGSFYNPEK